jgi:hypothetical protein
VDSALDDKTWFEELKYHRGRGNYRSANNSRTKFQPGYGAEITDRPGTNIRNVNLREEWQVSINPKNTIRQIAATTKMNDLEIRRIIYSLLQAGLVELVRPVGAPIQPKRLPIPQANKEEQTSLVNRLIRKIRSL